MDSQTGMSRHTGPGLYEFLMEAELQQYYPGIRGDLKVQTTAQLKYVTEEDLNAIGMSKPEMRRLKKYFQKHFPQNYLSKFKKMLLPKREEQTSSTLGVLPEERQDRPPIRVPNKHMIPADAIIVNKELGTGEFGVVQQGVWTNDGERIQVAIKCLSRERMQNNPIEFLKEAAIMHAIDHEHIVRLYGVVLDTNSLMLVTELAPLRSLLECLKEPSLRASFPVLSLCDFAIQISDGMQYLEAKRLIHRDLAARNILVFSKNKVKISDFGLSRALGVGKDYYQTNFNVNLKLPIAWCAPECISYLKFTSASDVWAYGVTLWEMFSYGFQPWAALTGQQILEAIDEPNFQRLEQPECCPKDYFLLMEQCWQHEPAKRPKFSELTHLLPDLKPEQVQAVQDSTEESQLVYRQGDVLTVLDKGTLSGNANWKGVLANGKTGFFNPAHTIAYLGSNLPSNKMGEFTRGDGKNAFSSQRKKIRPDMISSPQGDLKHTGHVGLDGAYFGDVSFLGGKYPHLPRQVVNPYKPHEDVTDSYGQITEEGSGSELARNSARDSRDIQHFHADMIHILMFPDNPWSDTASDISHLGTPVASTGKAPSVTSGTTDVLSLAGLDHEYHEISDEESHDSPLRFDKPLNFDFGPSLLDEMDQMFRSLGSSPPPPPPPPPPAHPLPSEHDSSNVRNELREIQSRQSGKKKQATVSPINVKPISAADQRTLYSAIAMAQELTARSMTDLEHPPESPRTPVSPSRRRKFSFKLPHQHSPKPDRRHFAEEAASIPDIQWLCSSLQSLSSTVSSIESLGAPSTLKLPLWDKASAEFCFAKSRELLTKPSAWTSYMEMDFETRTLDDNSSAKETLVRSNEYSENENGNGNVNGGRTLTKSTAEPDTKLNITQNGQTAVYNMENANFHFARQPKRVSASYVDRYFELPKYFDDGGSGSGSFDHGYDKKLCYQEDTAKNYDKMLSLEEKECNKFYDNFKNNIAANDKFGLIPRDKITNRDPMYREMINSETRPDELKNLDVPMDKVGRFEMSLEKLNNFEQHGTRPKISTVCTMERNKKFDPQKQLTSGIVGLATKNSSVGTKTIYSSDDSIGNNLNLLLDNPRVADAGDAIERNLNGRESHLPFVISSNPVFIAEPEKKDSPLYDSSESLRANFQRFRRKSDAEANNQTELSSRLFAAKYQREVSGLESVKNYLDSRKGQGFNLGLGKLTQNMIQLGKNIAHNTRHFENSVRKRPEDFDKKNGHDFKPPSLNIPLDRSNLDLNIPVQNLNPRVVTKPGLRSNIQKLQQPSDPNNFQQHILEPPKLYQNDESSHFYRHRTSSLSDNRKVTLGKNQRRSFHPKNESSEDSDSVSRSETDIRSRFRYKRRHKKMSVTKGAGAGPPHSLRLNFNTGKKGNQFLHPDSARGFSSADQCGKSPPPSTSFLNSLSPPFSSRNNLLSWPESAPSSSLTFTSNSDLESDTSSEYPEFTNDLPNFPPSPAP
ncbi:uncharacterized protein Ack-like isoform X2 [Neodiprion pinetum]|uniref:non-specific protein-tyrosine kinase n=1 Tax=Neodiprion lecontei TaxID=441921 RepID=A0ABM3FZI9_NEOLC|nr:uncharacterized protein LOC124217071 isoform X2 [Neodiprion pinetum]XP_046593421.1 uncharacterized protein LOC107220325 isoform X2 [Neodiprion lecontei]